MSKTTIIFNADSTDMPGLILEVDFDFCEGEPALGFDNYTGPEPGVPPHVEGINSVRCTDIDDETLRISGPGMSKIIGELCLLADRKQIEEKVFEAHNEDAQGDPDRGRE